jgi:hypothetical protein
MERKESAYEDRPSPTSSDPDEKKSGSRAGRGAVSPGAHQAADEPIKKEREREGGGDPDERG